MNRRAGRTRRLWVREVWRVPSRGPADETEFVFLRRSTHRLGRNGWDGCPWLADWLVRALTPSSRRFVAGIARGRTMNGSGYWEVIALFVSLDRTECEREVEFVCTHWPPQLGELYERGWIPSEHSKW